MLFCKPSILERLKGNTICVTGFSGYVGRHLLETLQTAGIRPFLIARPGVMVPASPVADSAAPWRDAAELAEQIKRLDNPVILNLAGHFVGSHTAADIPKLVSGNLEFPLLIFEALKLSSHCRIVNVGTSWEYSDSGEEEPVNLYAQLKAANARCLELYARQSPLQAVNLKLNDTYGGSDTRAKLLPLLKGCWINRKDAQLRAWAQPINLLHITDVQEALFGAALYTLEIPPHEVRTAFLLGGETIPLGILAERLNNLLAPYLSVRFEEMARENRALRGVWEDAPRLPNWAPRISLDEGLTDYFRAKS